MSCVGAEFPLLYTGKGYKWITKKCKDVVIFTSVELAYLPNGEFLTSFDNGV